MIHLSLTQGRHPLMPIQLSPFINPGRCLCYFPMQALHVINSMSERLHMFLFLQQTNLVWSAGMILRMVKRRNQLNHLSFYDFFKPVTILHWTILHWPKPIVPFAALESHFKSYLGLNLGDGLQKNQMIGLTSCPWYSQLPLLHCPSDHSKEL